MNETSRKTKSLTTLAFVLIAAVALLGVLVWQYPAIMQQLTGKGEETLTMVFVVEYEDGSEQRFEQPALSLVPLTITDTSIRAVKSVRTELYATVDYEGTITSWTINGLMYTQLLEDGAIKYQQQPFPFSKSESSSPPKNTAFVVASATVTAAQIEQMYSGWKPASSYGLRFTVQNPVFSATFSDGTTESKTASGVHSGTWSFRYSSSHTLSSVSVTWHSTPTY